MLRIDTRTQPRNMPHRNQIKNRPMKRLHLQLLALLLSVPCTPLRAADTTKPVNYEDGRLSNGIISVVFDQEGRFSIRDAKSDEVLLSEARFALPWGRRGSVDQSSVEDVRDVLGVGKRVTLTVTDSNELRYKAATKRLFTYTLYEGNPALVCGFGAKTPNYLSRRLSEARPLGGGR